MINWFDCYLEEALVADDRWIKLIGWFVCYLEEGAGSRLIDWLIDWLIGSLPWRSAGSGLMDWLIDWLFDWFVCYLEEVLVADWSID